jgi:hypothetical protein
MLRCLFGIKNNTASARNILHSMKIIDEFLKFGKECNFNTDYIHSLSRDISVGVAIRLRAGRSGL